MKEPYSYALTMMKCHNCKYIATWYTEDSNDLEEIWVGIMSASVTFKMWHWLCTM